MRLKIWQPLINPRTSTRAFELLPGSFESDIVLKFHLIEDFDNPTEYEAISYAWGDEDPSQEITVNDQRYKITQNLCTCLRHFRKLDGSRMLWADAICINQEDIIEKGHQVSIIGKIFQSAVAVLAWIGEEADGSDELFEVAQAGAPSEDPSRGQKRLWAILRLLHLQKPSRKRSVYDPQRKNYEALWHSWASLAGRPYWTRTWIIQEILLAKNLTVCCGKRQIDWEPFITWFGYLSRHLWSMSTSPRDNAGGVVFTGLNREMWQRGEWGLFFVIYNFDYTYCTNRLDKVYALLSLATPEKDKDPLVVDYTIDFMELYFRTFEYLYRPSADDVLFGRDGLRLALKMGRDELSKGLAERPDFLQRVGCTKEEVLGQVTVGVSANSKISSSK